MELLAQASRVHAVSKKICFFEKFKCDESTVKDVICADYDADVSCCNKHLPLIIGLININVAPLPDIKLFVSNDKIAKYSLNNYIKKGNLLKKIKLIIELAESGKLLTKQLDPAFVLFGIHYYPQFINFKHVYGWAFMYHDNLNRIAHIYLDEITDDVEVQKTLECIAFEIINTKHYTELPIVQTYFRYPSKKPYGQMEKIFKKPYLLNIKHILDNLIR